MGVLFKGVNKFEHLEIVPGGSLLGYAPYTWGNGSVFYVDSRSWGSIASDDRPGTNPNEPLATIQAAIDKCTDGMNDYVICLDGYDNDEATITIDKSSIHVIGVGTQNHRAPWVWLKIAGTGGAPVFTLVQNDGVSSEIAGFALAADSSHPCMTTAVGTGVQMSFCHLHHLAFAASWDAAYLAQDGFYPIDAAVPMCITIEDCTFGAQLARDGIRFKSLTGGLIKNCLFNNVGAICIDSITGGTATGMPDILNNKFRAAHGASEGWAITSIASGGGLIDDNHASADFEASGVNPYLDHADLNQWGLNYGDLIATYPATT